MTKPETNLTNRIVAALRRLPESKVEKIHGGPFQVAGLPDIDAVHRGRAVKLEVKMPGNRPTALQDKHLREYRAAGAIAEVVYSVDQALLLVAPIYPEVKL